MNIRRFVVGLLALTAAACSGDASGPQIPQLSGQWTYNASNITGGGISCNMFGVSFNLTQSGTTFTGTTLGGSVSCSAPGAGTFNESLGNDVIANGTINGNAITFDIGTPDIHHTGSISGSSMSGVVVFKLNDGQTTTTLTGNFSAVKM
jgi:hypothetical protein